MNNLFQSSTACTSDSCRIWHVWPYFLRVLGSHTQPHPSSNPASLWLLHLLCRLLLPLLPTWENVLFQSWLLCFIDFCISAATPLFGEIAPPSESSTLPRSYVRPWGKWWPGLVRKCCSWDTLQTINQAPCGTLSFPQQEAVW